MATLAALAELPLTAADSATPDPTTVPDALWHNGVFQRQYLRACGGGSPAAGAGVTAAS
eukprot:COSAG04_NODE_15519_length_528_cov_1.593023_2_plen_58_part_01